MIQINVDIHVNTSCELDQLGLLYYHEPHFVYTGQSYYFTNTEICDGSKKQDGDNIIPNYDYGKEIELRLNRLTQLTEKEKSKLNFLMTVLFLLIMY